MVKKRVKKFKRVKSKKKASRKVKIGSRSPSKKSKEFKVKKLIKLALAKRRKWASKKSIS